jgi:hypothetical protein
MTPQEEVENLKRIIKNLIKNVKISDSNGFTVAGWGSNAFDEAMDAINGWDDPEL